MKALFLLLMFVPTVEVIIIIIIIIMAIDVIVILVLNGQVMRVVVSVKVKGKIVVNPTIQAEAAQVVNVRSRVIRRLPEAMTITMIMTIMIPLLKTLLMNARRIMIVMILKVTEIITISMRLLST